MTLDNSRPAPIINKTKPETAHQQRFREQRPTQTAWLATFKRILNVYNTRSALLWLTGGILFCVFGKQAIQRRDQELMINDLDNYLKNKKIEDSK